MSGLSFHSTIVLKDVDVDVEVEYSPGTRIPAKFSGDPDSWHPDESEPPEILAVRALLPNGRAGKDVTHKLDARVMDDLVRKAWEAGEAEAADHYSEPDYD